MFGVGYNGIEVGAEEGGGMVVGVEVYVQFLDNALECCLEQRAVALAQGRVG